MNTSEDRPKYKTREEVDFVIIGSGAAGGVLARELSTSGFRVVVLEQGHYRTAADFKHEELEPYYSRVEWECGVSGQPGPFEAPRSRPYPVPPMPVKSSGVLFEKGARAMGLHPQPAPLTILSKPLNGRPACVHCGFCMGFGCEVNAKSSTLASMIPLAEATGRCEIRPLSTVFRIETNDAGRVTEVVYLDSTGQEQAQKTRAVIVCANGAETPRLLFLSESSRAPNGLANSSGIVGKYLMGNDPANSVVDKYHRAHDVPNLFVCDGSSFVSSGRGQPTMTIQALAFRAAEHITRFARNGEI